MENHAQNKLKMYKLVLSICAENAAVTNTVASIQPVLSAVEQKVQQLETLALQQASLLLGVKEEKNQHRLATIAKLEIVAGALKAYAVASGDAVLKAKVRFTPSRLKGGGSLATLQAIDRIIEAANDHMADLQDNGILASDIAELETLRSQLDTQFIAPRNAIADRKTKTSDVHRLIHEIDELLKGQLDNLVLVLRAANQNFYDRYQAARMIVDYKGKTNKPPVTPPDAPLLPPPHTGG